MAIKTNKSTDKVVWEKQLWTGLCNMKVVVVNPTIEELQAIGMNPKDKPVYTIKSDTGSDRTRLDIHLENKEKGITAKLALWVENSKRVAKSGIGQYIDDKSKSCFGDPASYKWMDKATAREAYEGEVDLHNFIKAWGNVANEDVCRLDTVAEIAKGNVKELKDLIEVLKDNDVRVLLGIKEDAKKGSYYQGVYNRYFGRTSVAVNMQISQWKKQLLSEYGEFTGHNWQNDFMLKSFIPSTKMDTVSPTSEDALNKNAQELASEGF